MFWAWIYLGTVYTIAAAFIAWDVEKFYRANGKPGRWDRVAQVSCAAFWPAAMALFWVGVAYYRLRAWRRAGSGN